MHKNLDEFEFLPDPTSNYGVLAALERLRNQCLHFFLVVIDTILLNLQITRKGIS